MVAAWLTPVFMGLTPIFGKAATLAGVDPFSVAGWRTLLAALLLWGIYLIAFRRYLFIFPAGLLGTFLVGLANGLGSLLFYNGLTLLDASLAQLLYMLYFVFAMLLTRLYGQPISRLSRFRALLAVGAVVLLTGGTGLAMNWRGVAFMIGAALMYAVHVVLSQRVMYEMPAPTMTIYAMTAMALTVTVAWLIHGRGPRIVLEPIGREAWFLILGLTTVTALSRLTLFAGVKELGGVQAILLNVAELFVALISAIVIFGDYLTILQWLGAALLIISMLLSQADSGLDKGLYRPLLLARLKVETPAFTGFTPYAFRLFQLKTRQ
jgi:drug/metabolite transporter (DMT)-like permease